METVFLAGASGYIGKPTLKCLVESNFKVFGVTKHEEYAAEIEAAGGIPVVCDLREKGDWINYLQESDIVIDLIKENTLDDIFGQEKAEHIAETKKQVVRNIIEFTDQDRLSAYLLILSSDAYLAEESQWIDETSPLKSERFGYSRTDMDAHQLLIQHQLESNFPVIFCHFGLVYGNGIKFQQHYIRNIRNGNFPIISRGNCWHSLTQLEDAARALVFLAKKKPVGERINFVDDEPVKCKAFANYIAKKLGAPKPYQVTQVVSKMMIGNVLTETMIRSRRVKNDKMKKLGFKLKYQNYQAGLEALFNTAPLRDSVSAE